MEPSAGELERRGLDALEAGDVASALSQLREAAEHRETGDVLVHLAEATHRTGDIERALGILARACTAYEREGRPLAAARVARSLAYRYVLHGDGGLASGWVGRARRLVGERRDTVEGRWVELFDAVGDPRVAGREQRLRALVDAARVLGDRSLECDALGLLGRLCVDDGRVDEGMGLLEEALAAVHAGEVGDLAVVEGAFCLMLGACEATQDVDRAEQWTRVGERLEGLRRIDTLGPLCRGYYAGVLIAAGRYVEAEDLLTDTVARLRHGYAHARDGALVRLADLRLRQGSLEAAEALLRGLEDHPEAAGPLAELHLARGRTALAREWAERALAGAGGPSAGRHLALLASIDLAAGDTAAAETHVARLEELATSRRSGYLTGLAALARGRVQRRHGHPDAKASLRAAVAALAGAHLPLALAEARVELAEALAGDAAEVAVAEARLALETGERLAAAALTDRAAALLRDLGAPAGAGPRSADRLTRREAEVLALLGHGLTNPEIAARLVISRKTVEHHVSRVLAKLGLRNRAEAAAHATREMGELPDVRDGRPAHAGRNTRPDEEQR